jgi:glycogen operon protein
VEGDTADASVLALRRRQARNFIAILMLSRGVPMLLAGDEVLRSQRGNNNAWCQDNELTWFDWSRIDSEREMLRFTRGIIAFRRRHPSLTTNRFYKGRILAARGIPDISWHGVRLDQPPWGDRRSRMLAFTIAGTSRDEADIHAALNMSDQDLQIEIPALPGRQWRLAVDTAAASPDDVIDPARQQPLGTLTYRVRARTVLVLEAYRDAP